MLSPGVSAASLGAKKNIGINVNGGQGQQVFAMGSGGTNTNVYADMLTREFLRLGYQTRTITENVSEATSSGQLRELGDRGFDLILISNLNFSTTTNMSQAMIGGGMKTGVTSFTLKGFDPRTGQTLFIASAEYGSAKAAGTVAEDVSALYRDVVSGKLKPTGAASPAAVSAPNLRATDETRASSAPSTRAPSAPFVQVSARPTAPSSRRVAPASAPRTSPVLVSPGARESPGPVIARDVVWLSWQPVENANGYVVVLKDLTRNVVVFSAEVGASESTILVPRGRLVAGRAYRWSSRGKVTDKYEAVREHFYFRR